ncbi:hypothetical protein AB205_0210490 [Aquarana catesbeiana]|uniref:Uncharacterized protein n=1 Tax=Aquarana catesbeiana TaxID=8400 RepID=A0A2G9S9V7_AQUCT|nr:hypothetical protein AB205_0210490 [Aquarana catesbeiana]
MSDSQESMDPYTFSQDGSLNESVALSQRVRTPRKMSESQVFKLKKANSAGLLKLHIVRDIASFTRQNLYTSELK